MSDVIDVVAPVEVVEPVEVDDINHAEEPVIEPTEEEKAEQEKQHKESRAQKRFDKLTREKYELKGRVEALQSMLQRGNEPQAQQSSSDKPQRSQYADDDSYFEALYDHKRGLEVAEERKRAELAKHEEATKTWQQKEETVRTRYPDYDEVIEESSDVFVSQNAIDAILDSNLGAEIRYYLAKNPDEAEATRGMSPLAAIRHIGKIEAKLELAKATKPQVKASSAPAPIKPIATKGTIPKVGYRENMSFSEYKEWRKKVDNKTKQ